ncbi:hypothetical protein ACIQVU_01290 [Lysinibacillus sp. NPDC098008]|uniref:hypothetical protein n=1 Tax=Lysinibacillus sp. NPDC098008 TaxID=3364146 RepID=UPI00380A2049
MLQFKHQWTLPSREYPYFGKLEGILGEAIDSYSDLQYEWLEAEEMTVALK